MTTPVKQSPLRTTGGNLYAGMKREEAEKKGVTKQFDFWDINHDKIIQETEVKVERSIKGVGKMAAGIVSGFFGGMMTAAGICAEVPSFGTTTPLVAGGAVIIASGCYTALSGAKIIGDTFTHNNK